MRLWRVIRLPKTAALLLAVWPMLAIGVVAATAGAYSLETSTVQFSVPVQPIDTALIAYAEQAHVQLVVSNTILKGLGVRGLNGTYDRQTALGILLRDTGLEFQITGPDTVTVTKKQLKN